VKQQSLIRRQEMSNIKSMLLIILGAVMLITIVGFGLVVPVETHAHPAYGFTPTPVPSGGGDDDHSSSPPVSPPEEEKLTDYVLVQLDQCDLECSEDFAGAEQIVYPLLASTATDELSLPLLVNTGEFVPVPEIQVPVQMIHQGSGWIVDEMLSTERSNRIMVPYSGQWEIFMTGQPRFITAEAVNVTGTNLAELQAQVANDPVSLGVVEANTQEAQLIRCPIQCVVQPPPPEEVFFLPETGGAFEITPKTALVITGLALFIMGLFVWSVIKLGPVEK